MVYWEWWRAHQAVISPSIIYLVPSTDLMELVGSIAFLSQASTLPNRLEKALLSIGICRVGQTFWHFASCETSNWFKFTRSWHQSMRVLKGFESVALGNAAESDSSSVILQ